MADETVYDKPSSVTPTKGKVAVKGPDSVDVHMTAEAAFETSDRLLQAAMIAKGMEIHAKEREQERQDRLS